MRRDFFLENGIYSYGEFNNFSIYYQNFELASNCSNIAYIPNTLIAVKRKNIIYVYKTDLLFTGNFPELLELAKFESILPYTCIKLLIRGKNYFIDSEAQVFTSKYPKST